MKILKMGEVPSESKMFICNYCGCEFIADEGEYSKCYSQGEDMMLYAASCPCCKRYVLSRQRPNN